MKETEFLMIVAAAVTGLSGRDMRSDVVASEAVKIANAVKMELERNDRPN
jgi:hypothetical protein